MKPTKRFLAISMMLMVIFSAAIFLIPSASAADPDYGYYTEQYLTAASTNATVFFNAPATTSTKQIVLKDFDVTGDHSGAVLYIYGGTVGTTINATLGTSVTNVTVASTNYFEPSDYVMIQRSAGTSTLHYIYSISDGTLAVWPAVTTACASGDRVYRLSNVSKHAVGAATLRKNGDAIFAAQIRMPLVLRLAAASGTNEYINSATVLFSEQHME